MRWMVYISQTCGTSVEDVHKMTTEAMESSDNEALGAIKVEAVEMVSMTQTVGTSTEKKARQCSCVTARRTTRGIACPGSGREGEGRREGKGKGSVGVRAPLSWSWLEGAWGVTLALFLVGRRLGGREERG